VIRIASDGGGEEEMAAEVAEATMQAAMLGLKAALLHLEGKVKKKLSGKRSGRWYRVPGLKGFRWHQASAPGEPPAVLFGHLRNSVTHRGPNRAGFFVSGEIGVGFRLAYAAILEWGGFVRGRRIAPRPYLRPTFDEEIQRVDRILQSWIDPYFVQVVPGSTL
jgi:hypothetical protein